MSKPGLRLRAGLRTRMIFLFLLIFGSTLVGFTYFLYSAFVQNHQREFDVALLNYTVDLAHSLDVDLFGGVALKRDLLRENEKVFPFSSGQTVIEIRSVFGQPVARSKNLGNGHIPLSENEIRELPERKAVFKVLDPQESSDLGLQRRKYRVITYFIDQAGPNDFALQVGAPMLLLESDQKGLIAFFVFSIPFVLFIAAMGGAIVSRGALAPLDAIIKKAREITAQDLSKRVPEPDSADQLRTLARTMNSLLDRLETAFKIQEAFLADASHQLKTPLAILRGEIDLMRSKNRSEEEIQDFFESASQEVNYLSRVVDDLLMLARIDAGASHLKFDWVRVDETLLEVCSRLAKLAEKKQVRLAPSFPNIDPEASKLVMEADPDLLRVLIENLAQNAVKYSPEGGVVSLEIHEIAKTRLQPAALEVVINDQGPGISEQERPHIFERFYRGFQYASSTSGKKGHGLGLAIAKRIAEIHGGSIRLEGASRFIVQLPKQRPA